MARESLTEIRETITRMRQRVESGACAPHMAAARLILSMSEQLLAVAEQGAAQNAPERDDEPEPCECDQVLSLRQSLAKAHAAVSAAGAQLRAAQGALAEAHEEVARTQARAWTAERELERARAWEEQANHCRNLADGAMKRARAERDGLSELVTRCLAKMPEGMEHGGCLETAVDLLCQGMLMPLGMGAETAREYDRLVAEYDGASRGSGEFSAPWAGQDAAEHDAKPDNPLDDPRMDGVTWVYNVDIDDDLLAAWPFWERGDGGVFASDVAGDLMNVDTCRRWRPLRLPGMNERGEIAAKDMTAEHFARAVEWQWQWDRVPGAPWHDEEHPFEFWDVDCDRQFGWFRPAIFAKLDHSA